MKGQIFEYLYQYSLFKEWNGRKINELLKHIPEEAPLNSTYKPPNSILLINLIDKWNCNFYQFIEFFEKTNSIENIQLGWEIFERNINYSKKHYFLFVSYDIVEEIEEVYPSLKINDKNDEERALAQINNFKRRLDLIKIFLSNFGGETLLFSQYYFYIDILSFKFLNKFKEIEQKINISKHNSLKKIEDELSDGIFDKEEQKKYEDMKEFIENEYKSLIHKRIDILGNYGDRLHIPKDMGGLPALVLRMRSKNKTECEIIKEIYKLNPKNIDRKDSNITNPMLGVLLSRNSISSDWKQIGRDALIKCNDLKKE